MLRLVQLRHDHHGRRVALVEEPNLKLLTDTRSVYDLARDAIHYAARLAEIAQARASSDTIPYDPLYAGQSDWQLLPPFDHPDEPARCLVSGTGLTHRASAENRQSMHGGAPSTEPITDSMKMYLSGVEGGKPERGKIGAMPEWFYKGCGTCLCPHGAPLDLPNYGDDGGEESEIAGCYVIGPDGTPYRVGLVQGNEYSDHLMEAKGYLHLAPSKLRHCAIGPEIVIDPDFAELRGRAIIERDGKPVWEAPLASGEKWMSHSLANLEHHHFRIPMHRRPGDAHVHFLGADEFSFRDRLLLEDGDVMVVAFEQMGRPLRNPLRVDRRPLTLVHVEPL